MIVNQLAHTNKQIDEFLRVCVVHKYTFDEFSQLNEGARHNKKKLAIPDFECVTNMFQYNIINQPTPSALQQTNISNFCGTYYKKEKTKSPDLCEDGADMSMQFS